MEKFFVEVVEDVVEVEIADYISNGGFESDGIGPEEYSEDILFDVPIIELQTHEYGVIDSEGINQFEDVSILGCPLNIETGNEWVHADLPDSGNCSTTEG